MSWWYLSFVDPDGWLGAVVVEGDNLVEALRNAHRRKINPGGGVAGYEVNPAAIPDDVKNRLLTFQDLEEAGAIPMTLAKFLARQKNERSS